MSAPQADALGPYLSEVLGTTVTVSPPTRVAMGQSRAMYIVDAQYDGGSHRTILRVEQGGFLGSDSTTEVPVMQALYRAGYPVAEIVAYEPSGSVIGEPFFVMAFVEGVATELPSTLDDYIRLLAQLHSYDPAAVGLDFFVQPELPTGPAHALVDRFDATYRSGLVGEPSPLLEEAIAWLRIHAPASDRVCVVHGDPGPGNYMHLDGQITAVVDWEFTHLGDEYFDWAYLIWMRGKRLMDPDAWIARIRDVAGVELDRERLRYWQAVTYLMGACIDQTATRFYRERLMPAPNLLAISTGVHLSALRRLYDTVLAD
jgi:aminoglycoside phosphotransferase (APT) family kinase protein